MTQPVNRRLVTEATLTDTISANALPARLSGTAQQVTGDWNSITAAGFYYGNALPNSPIADWVSVVVTSSAGSATGASDGRYAQQLATAWFHDAIYLRRRAEADWTPWVTVFDGSGSGVVANGDGTLSTTS